jgi:hypothetical protein
MSRFFDNTIIQANACFFKEGISMSEALIFVSIIGAAFIAAIVNHRRHNASNGGKYHDHH